MSSTASSSEAPCLRLGLTPGEPAGIGPDITVMLAQRALPAAVVCLADPDLLRARARALGLALEVQELDTPAQATRVAAGVLQVVPVTLARTATAGLLDPANAPYVVECLARACDACLTGELGALVTGPVQKSVINDAGIPFTGHTEFLAQRCGSPLPVMMLANDSLRVALLTTHVALRAVPDLVTAARIEAVVDIVLAALRDRFGIAHAHLGVCGLNPHAGEQGHLGLEDRDIISPCLERLRRTGARIDGPLPADTLFTADHRQRYDAILAMYHDQGLAALKALGFGSTVNVTLGLPIVRTSVDHGTALDLAGSNRARADSLAAALQLAASLASP